MIKNVEQKASIKNKLGIEDKIDLEDIKSLQKYIAVARLVDNKDVLRSIIFLRERFGFNPKLTYQEAHKWLKKSSDAKAMLGLRVSTMKQKYSIDYSFDRVITMSILAGKVTDKDYTGTAYCIEFPPEELDLVTDYLPRVAIIVSPETKTEEVEKLMRTKAQELFKEIDAPKRSADRAREEFKNAREWYWLKRTKTFPELAKHINKNGFIADEERVKKAVTKYRKNLKREHSRPH